MPADTTGLNERRNIRFPPQVSNVAVRIESVASVVDESLGGIALDIVSTIAVGQTVQVVYDGAPMLAEVLRVEPIENGSRLGLRWL